MKRLDGSRLAWHCVCMVCLVAWAGCGPANGRHSLEGRVTLDGEPVADGVINFRPQPGTPGPTAGGQITAGRFSIPLEGGTFAGIFRVEITAARKTGGKERHLRTGEMVDLYEQYLPARYNRQSELTAEVQQSDSNQFEFDLSSRKE